MGALKDQLQSDLTAAYAELGIGYAVGQTFQGWSGATLWSQEFGTRSPAATATQPAAAPAPTTAPKPKRHQPRRHARARVRDR